MKDAGNTPGTSQINNRQINKFTADKSTLEITFLDIKVCKGEILIGNPTLELSNTSQRHWNLHYTALIC